MPALGDACRSAAGAPSAVDIHAHPPAGRCHAATQPPPWEGRSNQCSGGLLLVFRDEQAGALRLDSTVGEMFQSGQRLRPIARPRAPGR